MDVAANLDTESHLHVSKCHWENFPFLSIENTFENIILIVEVKGNLGLNS